MTTFQVLSGMVFEHFDGREKCTFQVFNMSTASRIIVSGDRILYEGRSLIRDKELSERGEVKGPQVTNRGLTVTY